MHDNVMKARCRRLKVGGQVRHTCRREDDSVILRLGSWAELEVSVGVSPASLAELASRRCGGGWADVESRWGEEGWILLIAKKGGGGEKGGGEEGSGEVRCFDMRH